MKRTLLSVCFFIAAQLSLSAATEYYGHTVHITTKEGLDNNTINHIHYGSNDFVTFATDMGVSRYDGYRIRNYPLITSTKDVSGTHSIKYLHTTDIKGIILLQLEEGGLVAFDVNNDKYLSVEYNRSTSHEIESFAVGEGTTLYVGTKEAVFECEMELNANRSSVSIVSKGEPLLQDKIKEVFYSKGENIYARTANNQILSYSLTAHQPKEVARASDSPIQKVFQEGDNLWICTADAQIERLDTKRGEIHAVRLDNATTNFLYRNPVTAWTGTSALNYVIGTANGLYSLTFQDEELSNATGTDEQFAHSESAQRVKKVTSLMWNEKLSMLWVGTYDNGVLQLYHMNSTYFLLEQSFGADIVGLEEDAEGFVWVLTERGELWKSESTNLTISTRFQRWSKGLNPQETYIIYRDRLGNFWLGGSRGNIVHLTPTTGEATNFTLNAAGEACHDPIQDFILDSRNRLWVIAGHKAIVLNPRQKEGQRINLTYQQQPVEVFDLSEDRLGNMWLGTNVGLKRIDGKELALQTLADSFELEGNYEEALGVLPTPIRSIFQNSYNQLFATYNNKVVRIDLRDKDRVDRIYTLLDGLSNTNVNCMVDDESGNTWVGCATGVTTIRNDRDLVFNYSAFGYTNAACRMHDGRLLLGNDAGLTLFDPLSVKMEQSQDILRLAEVWVNGSLVKVGRPFNNQVILTTNPFLQQSFEFDAGNNNITFYFSGLQYGFQPGKQLYRLLPDEEWHMQELKEGISFNDLPKGDYTLQVKLVYPDSNESRMVELPIRVHGYWWESFYTRIGVILLILALSILLSRVMQHNKSKKIEIREREATLRERLSLNELQQMEKKKYDKQRNQLLAHVVEELRSPLSMVIAPLKELSRDENIGAEMRPKLQNAYRNALGMLDSSNQLLAIFTQENLADEKLKISPVPIEQLLDRVLYSVSELVKVNPIDFRCDKRIKKDLETWVDRKRIEFVIHNMLSNAFHHIRFAGSVRVNMQEVMRDGVAYCLIKVTDDGKYQDVSAEQSTLNMVDFGHSITDTILTMHHGNAGKKKIEGKGNEAFIEIPIGKQVFENDENILFDEPQLDQKTDVQLPTFMKEGNEFKAEELIPSSTPFAPKTDPSTEQSKQPRRKLLVVEDHKDIRLYLKVLFEKEYDLVMATNGQEGIDAAIAEHPDLILCDVMMPVKDGFQCCREIKENLETCSTPIIMLTAKVEDEDVINGLELGADDYILKPFTPAILKAKVKSFINNRLQIKQMYTKLLMPPTDEENAATETTDAETAQEKKPVEDPFITNLVKIIEENIADSDFSVKSLASMLNMSQPTLYRRVKQSTDFTIIEFIRGVRLRRAAILLKQKTYAVQEVAEMVGYNDIPTFRKHFVDMFGVTPSQYPAKEQQ